MSEKHICGLLLILSFQIISRNLFGPEMGSIWMSEPKCRPISYETTLSQRKVMSKSTARTNTISLITVSRVYCQSKDKRQERTQDTFDMD